jgi:acylphosphatase
MQDLAKVQLVVTGRVQGVFFRQSTRDVASQLGLSGWVRNQNDGSVALEAVGPRSAVEKLIDWTRKGPPSARVDNVAVEWQSAIDTKEGGGGFHILG